MNSDKLIPIQVRLTLEQVQMLGEEYPGFEVVGKMVGEGPVLFMQKGWLYSLVGDVVKKCLGEWKQEVRT